MLSSLVAGRFHVLISNFRLLYLTLPSRMGCLDRYLMVLLLPKHFSISLQYHPWIALDAREFPPEQYSNESLKGGYFRATVFAAASCGQLL